ncbi:hypothetical protein BT96DRAFT_1102791, partial [Gymnopus androsaceus JB14]
MSDKELEVFGVDWEGLQDETLLHSLHRNYAHKEGSSTWLGQHGPPSNLNEVQVDPPSGLMTANEIQGMDMVLALIHCSSEEGDVVQLWHSALIYAQSLY